MDLMMVVTSDVLMADWMVAYLAIEMVVTKVLWRALKKVVLMVPTKVVD